jgi:hypothetical protein
MSREALENLVRIGKLSSEPAARTEFDGLLTSARHRLEDAAAVARVSLG